MDNPCECSDMDLFRALIIITVDDGAKVSFWNSPWVNGPRPRYMHISRKKNSRVKVALLGNACVYWHIQRTIYAAYSEVLQPLFLDFSDNIPRTARLHYLEIDLFGMLLRGFGLQGLDPPEQITKAQYGRFGLLLNEICLSGLSF